jgi:guanylate kinase
VTPDRGRIFVVSAPSGAGKTTLCQKAVDALPRLTISVSYTTRQARPGEVPDIHYSFIAEDEFRSMINEGEFVEWAVVHSNFYGTSAGRIEAVISQGNDVILDIDVQGARKIRERYPESILIFILPPSMEALEKRLVGRMSDSAEAIGRRLRKAREEISGYKCYDYVIVNDLFEEAFAVFSAIIIAERSRIENIDHQWIRELFLGED